MLRVLVPGAKAAASFPLANEPGKGNKFRGQVGRDLNRHNDYLSWTAGRDRLLLALEKTVNDETSEPGHGDAGNAEEDKEEDFKCENRHDAILTVSR
ncbi:hypothetical protein Pure05_01540 [Paenarthrobacter ureafaciens]|nr:hypothetical protein NicSoilE8_28960 [Arthrobacter sp. NicSoilE8]GLU58657.1 hypothetical protein Pure01_11700 [Paenarthrobacter ureafaciens]GLU61903.1 hypothetical protein Pure02_01530 [Paenarthrobacter ureafaciens]GLU66177.1 hypothetical protein Pure03_01530 [Paenarthrobacter ureafaciens]GLU71499.1 hypothetical protein Pure04_12140 [Paenarthrobacter ureafaciens]